MKEILISRSLLSFLKFSFVWPREKEQLKPSYKFYLSVVVMTLLSDHYGISMLKHFKLLIDCMYYNKICYSGRNRYTIYYFLWWYPTVSDHRGTSWQWCSFKRFWSKITNCISISSSIIKVQLPINWLKDNNNIVSAGLPITEDFCLTAAGTESHLIAIIYLTQQRKIAKALLSLSDFDTFGEPKGLKSFLKRLNFYAKVVFFYTVFVLCFQGFVKFLQYPSCMKMNIQQNCGFLVPSTTSIIIDIHTRPVLYILRYIPERIFVQIFINVPVLVPYQTYELSQHLIFRLKHLTTMINKSFEETNPVVMRKSMDKCLSYHASIIKYVFCCLSTFFLNIICSRMSEKINGCFCNLMLINLVIKTIVLATILNVALDVIETILKQPKKKAFAK